jgi:hypothetical protein
MAGFGENFVSGMEAGQRIRARNDARKDQQALKQGMQEYFDAVNKFTTFDADEALPNVSAPASPAQALPVGEAAPAVEAAAASTAPGAPPTALPTGPPANNRRTHASFEDIQDIQMRAAKLAAMTGDPKVLEALQGSFNSVVGNRMLGHLSEAQTAFSAGDADAQEAALKNMSRLFPGMQGMKFTRADGQLMTKHPLTGKQVPVDNELMDQFKTIATNPDGFGALLGAKKAADAKEDRDERGVKVSEANAAANTQNAATAAANAAETARFNKATEQSANAQRNASALQSLAYADYLKKGGGKGSEGENEIDPNKARQFASDVRTVVQDTLFPTIMGPPDPISGVSTKQPGQPLRGYENATQEDLNRISSMAEQLGIANPSTGLSTGGQTAITIDRILKGDRSTGQGLQVMSDGTVHLTSKNGPPVVFRATPQLQQMIMAASAPRRAPPGFMQDQGLPMPPPRANAQGVPMNIAR